MFLWKYLKQVPNYLLKGVLWLVRNHLIGTIIFIAVLIVVMPIVCDIMKHNNDGLTKSIFSWFNKHEAMFIPDTVYVDTPPKIRDMWYEKVIYREVEPDTIQTVIYETMPTTVDFVSATITQDGNVEVEILINETTALKLVGELANYGETSVVVNPDTSVVVLTPRSVFEPILCLGINSRGVSGELELLHFNDIFLVGSFNAPNIVGTYDIFDDDGFSVGVSISREVSHRRSPIRFSAGALYSLSRGSVYPFVGVSIGLWRFF